MTWGQLSSINEPYNHTRRIVGFDFFEGFLNISEKDVFQYNNSQLEIGSFAANNAEIDIRNSIELYDLNIPISHISRVEVVNGNVMKTIPDYIEKIRILSPHCYI